MGQPGGRDLMDRWAVRRSESIHRRKRIFRLAEYGKWFFLRLFTVFFAIMTAIVPLIKYLMLVYEGREITLGQAAVFIIQTITTTGYGELLPFISYPMMAVSIFLMIAGVFMIFIFTGTLITILIERNIVPKAPKATRLTDHVIFTCYSETVDYTIMLLERNNIPYVVAEETQSKAVELIDKGINCICANPRSDEGLINLGTGDARLLIASSEDTENISIILGVSSTYNTPVLAVMENDKRAQLAYAAGASHVVILEETLGRQLVDLIYADALPTEFLHLIEADVSPEIMKQLKPSIIHIGSRSRFKNKTIAEARLRRKTGATIAAIWHSDGTITTPTADTVLNDSTLIVLGPNDSVDRMASYLGEAGEGKRVVLVGAGRVGQEAGKELNRANIYPIVIDVANKPLSFKGELIVGDSTKVNVLQQKHIQAHIKEADILIATIDNDNMNIFTVLASRLINPNLNVVAGAIRSESAERLHQAGASHVLSESQLGFQLLQIALVQAGILPKQSAYAIREVVWRRQPIQIQTLSEQLEKTIKIICVVREDKIIEPAAEYKLEKNDHIIVLGPPQQIDTLV